MKFARELRWFFGFLILGLTAVTAAASTRRVEFRSCGVAFTIPASWSAQLVPAEDVDDSVQCEIALRPHGWSKLAKRSRWGAPDPPLGLFVFRPDTSYDEALDQMGFETDEENGHGFGVPGGYGSFATAQPYQAGKSNGQAAFTFFRGFINDDALLKKDESRVYSGEVGHIVLKTPSARVIGFEGEPGTPDEPVDYDPVVQMIARSIVVKTRR
jgi:hypothetical protein